MIRANDEPARTPTLKKKLLPMSSPPTSTKKTANFSVLISMHTDPIDKAAGTELFTKELMAKLWPRATFTVATRIEERTVLTRATRSGALRGPALWPLAQPVPLSHFPSRSNELVETYLDILNTLRPDLIHVMHLMNSGSEIIDAAKLLDIPIIYSTMDFYSICPKYNLINQNGQYCGIPQDTQICSTCMTRAPTPLNPLNVTLEEWRGEMERCISNVDVIHFPSRSTRDLFCHTLPISNHKAWKLLALSFSTLPKLTNSLALEPETSMLAPNYKSALKTTRGVDLVVLGYSGTQKGHDILALLLPRLAEMGLTIAMLGSDKESWGLPPILDDNIMYLGPYAIGDLPSTLIELSPKASLCLSPWPETYMRTADEAASIGLPVIVLDIGAPAERVGSQIAGLVLPYEPTKVLTHIQQWAEAICSFIATSGTPLLKLPNDSVDQDLLNGYIDLYDTALNSKSQDD